VGEGESMIGSLDIPSMATLSLFNIRLNRGDIFTFFLDLNPARLIPPGGIVRFFFFFYYLYIFRLLFFLEEEWEKKRLIGSDGLK
jgi:hypothetical protein